MLSLPIPTDPIVIRSWIMHDVFLKKPVFEGYKDLCKIIPEFDYPEYDYWYYRFSAGNLDVNYDRSAEPEPLELEELPVDVLSKILEKVNVKNRFKIRKLSKTMLSVVDKLKTAYDIIDITCNKNSVIVKVDDGNSSWELQYSHTPNGCRVMRNYRSEEIVGGNFVEIALHDLGMILRPTKIRVENFEIRARDSKYWKRIVDLFVSISKKANAKFHVESAKIEIQEFNCALSVLSVMKPGVLKDLTLWTHSYMKKGKRIDMNQIKDMEQFKQAKAVDFTNFGGIRSTDVPLFLGFEIFEIRVISMEPEDVIRLRNDLSKPDNTIFKSCSIKLHTPLKNIVEVARVLGKNVTNELIRYLDHSCSIANSDKVLKFFLDEDEIYIMKTDPTPDDIFYWSDDSDSDDY